MRFRYNSTVCHHVSRVFQQEERIAVKGPTSGQLPREDPKIMKQVTSLPTSTYKLTTKTADYLQEIVEKQPGIFFQYSPSGHVMVMQ